MTVSDIALALLERPVDYLGPEEPACWAMPPMGSDIGDALAPLIESYGLRWRFDAGGVSLVESVESGRMLAAGRNCGRSMGARNRPANCSACRWTMSRHGSRCGISIRSATISWACSRRNGRGRDGAARSSGCRRRFPPIRRGSSPTGRCARGWPGGGACRGRATGRRLASRRAIWWRSKARPGRGSSTGWNGTTWRRACRCAPLRRARPIYRRRVIRGQPVLPPIWCRGRTRLALVELAAPEDSLAQAPLVFAAATGATAGWRRAALFRYRAETGVADPAGSTAPRAVLGDALTALAPGLPWRFDARWSVDIALDHPSDSLNRRGGRRADSRGESVRALAMNCCIRGRPRRSRRGQYRLSRLVRGWHGTEWAMAGHAEGEQFVLLDPARLESRGDDARAISASLWTLRASGSGDTVPAEAARAGRRACDPATCAGARRVARGGGRPACRLDAAEPVGAGCGATLPMRRSPRSAKPTASP